MKNKTKMKKKKKKKMFARQILWHTPVIPGRDWEDHDSRPVLAKRW
jgi:hypothetical protein